MGANERERARIEHENVVREYQKIIPVLKFKKEIEEFGATDCVICMEAFVKGAKVRKIPTCRHIFHD